MRALLHLAKLLLEEAGYKRVSTAGYVPERESGGCASHHRRKPADTQISAQPSVASTPSQLRGLQPRRAPVHTAGGLRANFQGWWQEDHEADLQDPEAGIHTGRVHLVLEP